MAYGTAAPHIITHDTILAGEKVMVLAQREWAPLRFTREMRGRVIACASSADKSRLKDLGADHVQL